MQATMKVKKEKLGQFQEMVKQFDFRFKGNPFVNNGVATVMVDADHLPMEKCNEFFAAWSRANTEIHEIPQKTKLQKFMKKAKKFFKQ